MDFCVLIDGSVFMKLQSGTTVTRRAFFKFHLVSRVTACLLTLLLLSPFISFSLAGNFHYVEVVVDGIGDTPQAAVRNAGENGLKKVLGSYLDTETTLLKKTEDVNGTVTRDKTLVQKYREYSRGVLKDIERISVVNENGIYRATAKVTVKVLE